MVLGERLFCPDWIWTLLCQNRGDQVVTAALDKRLNLINLLQIHLLILFLNRTILFFNR